jgi:zinc/manganese transport system substrate-binding protein/manganese/iron transport system substrate-binding protein
MALGVVLLAILGGLSAAPPSTQAQSKLHVIASFSLLADVVDQVAGDAVDQETLIPVGSNPHSFELSARDVATLSDAALVFVVGINFEEGLLDVLNQAAGENVANVSGCIPVRPVVEGDDHDHVGEDHDTTPSESGLDCALHHDAVAAAFGVERIDSGDTLGWVSEGVCEEIACDPHVWTDPANVALWTLAIRDILSARDPDNAALYEANTASYLTELAALDNDIQAVFAPIPAERRIIVTNHLTFNYFAARYGLTTAGVILPGSTTGSEPSAGEVFDLIKTIKESGAPAIFTETTTSDDLAQQIADETGTVIVQLYTETLSAADGPAATYLDYMRYNAEQIAGALR